MFFYLQNPEGEAMRKKKVAFVLLAAGDGRLEKLHQANSREYRVLVLGSGIQDGTRYRSKQIAETMGVSRTRVGQLEARALGRLQEGFEPKPRKAPRMPYIIKQSETVVRFVQALALVSGERARLPRNVSFQYRSKDKFRLLRKGAHAFRITAKLMLRSDLEILSEEIESGWITEIGAAFDQRAEDLSAAGTGVMNFMKTGP